MSELLEWIRNNDVLLWWLGIGSVVFFVGSALAMPWVVGRLPADYFTDDYVLRLRERRHEHPALRYGGLFLRNVLGLMLVLAGMAMLVLPGQGVLTILIGVALLTFPGKRRLILWVVSRRSIARGLNWLRWKGHHDQFLSIAPSSKAQAAQTSTES